MPRRCEVCGNESDLAFEVVTAGRRHVFDCFECAIHALAPACDHCGCRILGHGMLTRDRIYCCAHCTTEESVSRLAGGGRVADDGAARRAALPGAPTPWGRRA